ncbi:MAG: hypothetical protein AAFQ87_15600 [Bacteroidota bacterium]
MSTNRHPIDDLFRRGAGQREFAFQDSYWLQAEQMILAEQKRRKQHLLSLITYSLILVTVITIPLLVWILAGNPLLSSLRPVDSLVAEQSLLHTPPALREGIPLYGAGDLASFGERSNEVAESSPQNATAFATDPDRAHALDNALSTKPNEDPSSQGLPTALEPEMGELSPSWLLGIQGLRNRSFLSNKKLAFAFANQVDVPRSGYPKNELSLWLGFNTNPRISNPRDWGTHPVIGLRYTRALSPRLKLYTGLLYQGRGQLEATAQSQRINYGFGADIASDFLQIDRLHYIEAPLGLDLRVYKGHYLLVGAQMAYLANVSGQVLRRTEDSFGLQGQESSPAWGYTEGLRRWNPSVTAGYAYYWRRGLRLGAMANYHLYSPLDGEFLNSPQPSPFQLRIFAEFYLSHF